MSVVYHSCYHDYFIQTNYFSFYLSESLLEINSEARAFNERIIFKIYLLNFPVYVYLYLINVQVLKKTIRSISYLYFISCSI